MMLAKLKPKPTDEQCFILDQIRSSQSNLQINAFAGTGKSATLKMIDELMPESLLSLYLVFNKRNAEEAIDSNEFRPLIETENRRPVRGTKIQTLNGCGHGVWAQKAQDKIVAFVNDLGQVVAGITPAAIKGADGNQEFFACIRKRSV